MRTTWKKLLAMLLVIMMMLSCVVTTSAEDVTGGTSTDTTTETTQPEDTTEGDTTTEGGDTSTEGGDTTTEGGDTTTEGGDTTTEGGDTSTEGGDTTTEGGGTTTEGGDTTTEGGDTTTEGGDTTTEGGDTTTEGGDTTTEGGDTTTEGGESTEGGDTEDGENEDTQPDTTDKPALTEEMFSIGGSVNYTGSAQTVALTVVDGNLTPADYSVGEVTYDGSTTAPTNAETYSVSVVVTAKEDGAYQGSVTVTGTLTINRVSGEVIVTLSNPSVTYNGSTQTPVIQSVTVDGMTVPAASYSTTDVVGPDANTYDVTVTINDPNFDATSGTATMEIKAVAATLTVAPADTAVDYTGAAQIPTLTVTYDGTTLTEGTDYTVGWNGTGVDANTYTATITGKGNYAGSTGSATLTVKPVKTTLTVTPATTDVVYNGAAQLPALTVTNGSTTLTEGTDYTVGWDGKGVDANTYTATITGKGNYAGSEGSAKVTVAPVNATLTVSPADTKVVYNGAAQIPTLTVTYGNLTLTKDVDYTLEWDGDGVDVDTYTATITGKGNYAGSTGSATLTVTPVDATLTVSPAETKVVYNGAAQIPTLTVTYGNLTLTKDVDYTLEWDGDGVDVGTYTAKITGKGNFAGSEGSATLVVNPVDATLTVSPAETTVTYTREAQIPTLTVTYGNLTLTKDVDYTLEWDGEGIDAGTYTATITGIGNFAGSEGTAKLVIKPVDDTLTVDPAETTVTYTREAQIPTLTVTYGDLSLTKDVDYTLEWDGEGIDAGTYTATITGIGNFAGSEGTATLVVEPIADTLTVDPAETTVTYTRESQIPTLTLTYGNLSLTKDVDYTLEWDGEGVDVGTYTATITGIGNFKGSTGTATLVVEPIADTLTVDPAETTVTYTRESQIPTLTLTYGDLSLTKDVDYTLEWDGEGIDVGTYTATITGKGNFEGSTGTATLVVEPIATEVTVDPAQTQVVYNGVAQIPTLTVSCGKLSMEEDVDYTLEWDGEGIDAGTYTATITGIGNFEGSTGTATLVIDPLTLSDTNITIALNGTEWTYTALEQPIEIATLTFTAADGSVIDVTIDEYEWPELVVVGDYTLTVTGNTNFTGTYDLPYSIKWLATPANPYTLDGDIHGEWYYGEGGVTIVPAEGYKVAADHSDAAAFADTLTITDCYWDNNTTQIYLQDANGGITNVIPVETFMLDSVKPNVADISMSSSTAFIHVTANDAFSGAVISLYVYNTESDPIEQETADHTVEKVLVAGFAGEEISFSYTVTDEGTYIVEVSDVAGNLAESKTVYYGDKDSDGLNDAFEAYWGSDPENADSDGDGLLDSHEYILQTDPLNPDTDGDTLNDFDEARTYETDPLAVDGDQDGIDDPTSVMLRVFFEGQNLPTAVAAQTGTLVNGAAPALTPAELQEKLSALLAGGTEVSLYTRRGRDVRNADGDVIKLSNDDYGNIVVIKIDQANERVFAIDTEKMVLLAFRGEKNVVIESAIDLKEILGEDVQNIAYASDDSGSLLMLAAWDGDKAASDLMVVVTDQLFGEDAVAYVIDGSAGSTRFAVSPDGSKIAFLQDEITVADLAAGEATFATGATISFTADGRLITDMSGNAQDGYTAAVCKVDTSALELTSEPVAFSGTYYLQQPNLGGAELLVVLPAGQSEQYPDGYSITLPMTVLVTLSENMDVLGYLPLEGEDVSFHSASMAE